MGYLMKGSGCHMSKCAIDASHRAGARTSVGSAAARLALIRRNRPDPGCELCVSFGINRPVSYRAARRVLAKEVVVLPILRWPDWSRNEAASTVGAHVAQDTIDA